MLIWLRTGWIDAETSNYLLPFSGAHAFCWFNICVCISYRACVCVEIPQNTSFIFRFLIYRSRFNYVGRAHFLRVAAKTHVVARIKAAVFVLMSVPFVNSNFLAALARTHTTLVIGCALLICGIDLSSRCQLKLDTHCTIRDGSKSGKKPLTNAAEFLNPQMSKNTSAWIMWFFVNIVISSQSCGNWTAFVSTPVLF